MNTFDSALIIIGIILSLFSFSPAIIANEIPRNDQLNYNGFFFQEDTHVYASFVKQAVGKKLFVFENKMTVEKHSEYYILLYHWMIGKAVEFTGINLVIIFYLFQSLSIIFFIYVFGKFSERILKDKWDAIFASLLLAFGTGLNWVFYLVEYVTGKQMSFLNGIFKYYYSPSTFAFAYSAHFYLATGLFLLALIYLLNYYDQKEKPKMFHIASLLTISFTVDAGTAPVLFLTIPIVMIFYQKQSLENLITRFKEAWPIWATMGIIGLYVWVGMGLPVIKEVFSSFVNFQRHTTLFFLPLTYGIILVPFIVGLINEIRKKEIGILIILFGIFLYASQSPKGIKYLFLLHIPVILICVVGIKKIASELKVNKDQLFGIFLIVTMLSVPFITIEKIKDARDPTFQRTGYLNDDEVDMISKLNNYKKGNVLSSYNMGSNIAWMTNHYTLLGDSGMTPFFPVKEKIVERIFKEELAVKELNDFVEKYRIDYLIIPLSVKKYNNQFLEVYRNNQYKLFVKETE